MLCDVSGEKVRLGVDVERWIGKVYFWTCLDWGIWGLGVLGDAARGSFSEFGGVGDSEMIEITS